MMTEQINYAQIERNFIDYILHITGPSKIQDIERNSKTKIIKDCILNALVKEREIYNVHIFCFGSFSFKSYHQNSDIDITFLLEDKKTKKLLSPYTEQFLNQVLENIKNYISNYCHEKNIDDHIEKIDAEVKLIKVNYEGVSFDISFHNFPGLFKLIFMHHLEQNYLKSIFYKRTLLLIKAFCYYEATILGSNVAALGSYALEILVIYVFNNHSDKFRTELEAFFTFFDVMNQINWEKKTLTIYGLFDQSQVNNYNNTIEELLKNLPQPEETNKITYKKISEFTKQFERFTGIDKVQKFNQNFLQHSKSMYIIDPIFPTNNLAKSVNPNNFSRIKEVFAYMAEKADNLKKMKEKNSFTSASEYFNILLDIFHDRVISCNPDLFRLNLPEPKIVIVTGKAYSDFIKKDEDNSDLNMIIQSFNKQFTVEEKEGENKGEKIDDMGTNNKNKLNGLLWPSSEDNLDEQTLIDYQKKNITNINYITKDIHDFVNKNNMSLQQKWDDNDTNAYEFKTDGDAEEAENFVKSVLL